MIHLAYYDVDDSLRVTPCRAPEEVVRKSAEICQDDIFFVIDPRK